jgi:membrane associated rhomboid family serine protease
VLTAWLLSITLFSAYLAGSQYLAVNASVRPREHLIPPRFGVTLTLFLTLAATATLQWIFPVMLLAFERDASRIAAGEWWRLMTALFAQNGGVAGTVFNLVSLLLVGTVAERIWGGRRWLVIFFAGGVMSEVVAMRWQPIGAGNSVANFSLAAAVSVLCLVRRPATAMVVAGALALAAGAVLLLMRDIHGAATSFGAIIGLVLIGSDGRTNLRAMERRAGSIQTRP